MFDESGYIQLIDFGMAREEVDLNGQDCSGTPGYMAPEVFLRDTQGPQVDVFAIGVICHELMLKTKPWPDTDRLTYISSVMKQQVVLNKTDTPETWVYEASDFINKCIKRKPSQRLGLNGTIELKAHIWFKDFDWRSLFYRHLIPPFVPKKRDNFSKEVLAIELERRKVEEQSGWFKEAEQRVMDVQIQD
jgi:serine/threonine protein kinase